MLNSWSCILDMNVAKKMIVHQWANVDLLFLQVAQNINAEFCSQSLSAEESFYTEASTRETQPTQPAGIKTLSPVCARIAFAKFLSYFVSLDFWLSMYLMEIFSPSREIRL